MRQEYADRHAKREASVSISAVSTRALDVFTVQMRIAHTRYNMLYYTGLLPVMSIGK